MIGIGPNSAYLTWLQHDQLHLSALLSSLSLEVLSQVLLLNTSAEVWAPLERMFTTHSSAGVGANLHPTGEHEEA